ncbi:subtilisin-like protein [Lactarius quietus]|nr:subtilisin-like protein [Lactarius quietus]
MRYSWLSAIAVLSAGPLCIIATPLQQRWGEMRAKSALKKVNPDWICLGPPVAETTIDLHIALQSQHENALVDTLYQVSTPSHPKYGAHLSKEQVAELVAPHPDTVDLVSSWLVQHGVSSSMISMSHGGSWLTVNGLPTSQANDLLDASYQLYRYSATNVTVLRTTSYGLPEELYALVKTVAPTTYFGLPPKLRQSLRKRSSGPTGALEKSGSGELVGVLSRQSSVPVAPSFLRSLYNTTKYVPSATDRNTLALVGYLSEFPSTDDLSAFMNAYRPDGASATFTSVDVGVNPSDEFSAEANVDIQYTEAITYPTPIIYYSTANGDSFLAWLNNLLNDTKLPQTISAASLGSEQEVIEDYAIEMCNLFAQLGVRGASVIFSSGDSDVSCTSSGTIGAPYLPTFPASCPWVTSVGGTVYDSDTSSEIAASFSSGGFSNYFVRPAYQGSAVPPYIQQIRNLNGHFNSSGRGFPDMAAQAANFQIIYNGAPSAISSTGCSADTVAALISLLNDYLLSTGRPPLGFLNPWLYANALPGLFDITTGSSEGCNNSPGFPALSGWDAVTGLGTPNFFVLQGPALVL